MEGLDARTARMAVLLGVFILVIVLGAVLAIKPSHASAP
jgi:hypothetical protein